MGNIGTKTNKLNLLTRFTLFVTSYTPLFILVCFKQVCDNWEYFNWGCISKYSIFCYFEKFGFSTFLIAISIFGILGINFLLSNLKKNAKNGDNVIVRNLKNKNSESMNYIATYIFPFLFQDTWDIYEIIAFVLLMIIIYRIYINSTLIIMNPVLNFLNYSIFEIDYEMNNKVKMGIIIIKNSDLIEDSMVKIYPIGNKMFYAKLRENNN